MPVLVNPLVVPEENGKESSQKHDYEHCTIVFNTESVEMKAGFAFEVCFVGFMSIKSCYLMASDEYNGKIMMCYYETAVIVGLMLAINFVAV